MTDEEAALLNAIHADPDDDLVRLVYADWLDEHGQPERAEFIRVQIEMARLENYSWPWIRVRDRVTELETNYRNALLIGLDSAARERIEISFDRGFVECLRTKGATPADFQFLHSLSDVREVWIADGAVSEEVVRDLSALQQLDELYVWRVPFQAEWLELLDALPPWTCVYIDVKEEGFAAAWAAFQTRRIARIAQAPLERLRGMFRRRLGDAWQYREYLPPGPILRGTLRRASEFDLVALSHIPELEAIRLADGNESETGLRALTQAPSLRSIELFRTEANTLTALTGCERLERLHVTSDDGVLTDVGTAGIERLVNLRDLLLNGGPDILRDETLRRLAPLTQLQRLEVHFGELTGGSLSVLAGLTNIEILKLNGPTKDDDARYLAELTDLICLSLIGSQVSDSALGYLTRLRKLRTLEVRQGGTRITEAAARALATLLPEVTIIIDDCVVKAPRKDIVFRRLFADDSASVLIPKRWLDSSRDKGDHRVWVNEEGWEHVGSLGEDRFGEIVLYRLDVTSKQSAEDELQDYLRDHYQNPEVLEQSIASFAIADSASCIFREGSIQHFVGIVHTQDDRITLICRIAPARFEEFRPLFLFVARSLRVGEEAKVGVGEEVTVAVSDL